jgi:hypothetical protein
LNSESYINAIKPCFDLIHLHRDVFYFILTFAGMSTIDIIVVPALNRFIKNVYIFNIEIWNAMEKSFGEDRHALNQTSVFISFVMMQNGPQGKCQCIVDTRVFAYNNLKDGQEAQYVLQCTEHSWTQKHQDWLMRDTRDRL